jgi:hypothetical protein
MNQKDLKTALKPIVKELIYECLITEGILSSVVSEVMKGSGNTIVSESKQQINNVKQQKPQQRLETNDEAIARRKKLEETLVGKLGVNVFEGTQPLNSSGRERGVPSQATAGNPLSGLDPSDSGVDISGLLNLTGGWKRI